MKRGGWASGAGALSLVLIFAVLCLSVFAILTLSTASSERILTEKIARSTRDYYAADAKATAVFAELRQEYAAGRSLPHKVDDVPISTQQSGEELFVSFRCEQGSRQELLVELLFMDKAVRVLTWKTEAGADWSAYTDMDIWGGQ